jgi:hypothetical protein
MKKKPLISVIVVFFNMAREAPRTLFSLSSGYQQGASAEDYEVIAVDCGSETPLGMDQVSKYGSNFRLIRTDPAPSPARAINKAAREAQGHYLTICIDGARIWSPGIIAETCTIIRDRPDSVIATPAFHLGHEMQNISISRGYNQEVEDRLLQEIGWETDGYRLFQISSLDGSSQNGWFLPLQESNCITVPASLFNRVEGYDERFSSPGGGLVNLDFFDKVCRENRLIYILTSEGTFHQFHGGVSTNIPLEQHPWKIFCDEYEQLFSREYVVPDYCPVFWGLPRAEAGWMLQYSFDKVYNVLRVREDRIRAQESTILVQEDSIRAQESTILVQEDSIITLQRTNSEFQAVVEVLQNEIKLKDNLVDEANTAIGKLEAQSDEKQQTIVSLNRQLAEARHELYEMANSKSWQLTRPLRILTTLIQTSSVWAKIHGNHKD